jgi:hypothetical protein
MLARLLAALVLSGWLAGCAAVSSTPEQALAELIEDAAAGRSSADRYHNVDPVDEPTIRRFLYVEEWLDVNGESVVGARPAKVSAEGAYRFTLSADGRVTYLICLGWPGPQVRSRVLRPLAGSTISLLGWPDRLAWEQLGAVCVIGTPPEMADEENHPCRQAFVFRVEAPR